jgi:hypothetical protein
VVSILTVTSADGVVVRRRLLAAEGGKNGRVSHVELHEAADGSLSVAVPPVAHAQRRLLQTAGDVDRVADSFGNSGLLVTNEAVDPQLNLARLAGATDAWQFVTVTARKANAVPVHVFTQNARALLRAASSKLGTWVRDATPVTFVPELVSSDSANRRLLQYNAVDRTFDVTAVLHLANVNTDAYGTLRVTVLKCLFAQIDNNVTILGAGSLADATAQCSGTQLQAWMASNPTFVDAETVIVGDCGKADEYVGASRCMGLLLNVTYDTSIADANVEKLALEQAKVQFQLTLGVALTVAQTDRAYAQTLRRVVADAMRVPVERVVIEFSSVTITAARRLLQTFTTATVWLYDYPRLENGVEVGASDLGSQLAEGGALQQSLATLAAETPVLQLSADIDSIKTETIAPPRLPNYQWRVRFDVDHNKLSYDKAHEYTEVQKRVANAVNLLQSKVTDMNVDANRLWSVREGPTPTTVRTAGDNLYSLSVHVEIVTEERSIALDIRNHLQTLLDDQVNMPVRTALAAGLGDTAAADLTITLHGVESLLPGTGEVSGLGLGSIVAIVALFIIVITVVAIIIWQKDSTAAAEPLLPKQTKNNYNSQKSVLSAGQASAIEFPLMRYAKLRVPSKRS